MREILKVTFVALLIVMVAHGAATFGINLKKDIKKREELDSLKKRQLQLQIELLNKQLTNQLK